MGEWGSDEVVGASSREADLCDRSQLATLMTDASPDVTVLAAAYTDVDGCEKNPGHAHEVNCVGAVNVAEAASECGSRLLFISTDYVFDGSKTVPYECEDAVCPINVYGISKAEAEISIRSVLPECCIVRTSWLFGAHGRCFPNTILAAASNHKSLRVVNDQRGSPTFHRDLAQAIVALVRANAEGTIHVTNRDTGTWYEFACELLQKAELDHVDVVPVSSSEFPRPARRPSYSVLSPASLNAWGISMRSWRDTLGDYLKDRRAAVG